MTFGIFEEVERLIEYIPIDCNTFQIDSRLAKGTSIDSKFYFEDVDGTATRSYTSRSRENERRKQI
jgi:hypothetical protein